ncbi:uncharacterized protein B0H18DRAFT_1020248 [Fomitopsis serialis]|uniref:uncharacterized protein n=1 Tax=Fomitopsis serialis TaxID=139415 RepID=UPI0020073A0E|nr:uncharacterized protein B0H18DRAFT_1020248 [Neoantrodia serialis]KAH9921801.1 hypothetical protein B0H18DRAFT_1020248 [Neoantrodia serialis]
MTEFHGPGGPLPHVPDDVTLVQFMLDSDHPSRPVRRVLQGNPWMIEDATGRQIGYGEVRLRTHGLANAMSSRWGIVCIFGPNHVDYPIAVWSIHRLGATATCANPAYTAGELHCNAAAKAVGLPLERIVLFDPLENSTSSYTHILQAEGKMGSPRCVWMIDMLLERQAVCIAHYAPIANVIQMAHLANQQPGPWEIVMLPFYRKHLRLVVIMHFMMFYGASLVVVPKFNFLDFMASSRGSSPLIPPSGPADTNADRVVPPMVVLLCKHPAVKNYDLSSIHAIMSGAAPLSPELTNQLSKILPQVSVGQGYGMTETSTTISFPQIEQKICTPGSGGRLVPGVIARVPGHLIVKGPANALRYLNNEQATNETFVDGWVHTGDEVMINEEMEVFIVDRIKELIKVRGFQVAPAELEGHILDHPDVADVCVVGLPDDYSGELPLAFAGVEFVDVIPKNPSGKLLRRVLRDRATELKKQGRLSRPPKSRM